MRQSRSSRRRDQRPVGEIFREKGVTEEEVRWAAEESKVSGGKTGELLVQAGVITPEEKWKSLAEQWNLPYVELSDYPFDETLIKHIADQLGESFLRRNTIIPLRQTNKTLTVAGSNPLAVPVDEELRFKTGCQVEWKIAVDTRIRQALEQYLGPSKVELEEDIQEVVGGAPGGVVVTAPTSDQEEVRELEDDPNAAPIIRLVNLVLVGGIRRRASDIHIQPEADRLRVRYRVDGVLTDAPELPMRFKRAIAARIKVMSDLRVAEHRKPQDGRTSFSYEDKEYDLRVSLVPGIQGEKIVMRIAEKAGVKLDLKALGFEEGDRARFEKLVGRPNGMILVTGPTGSGKTTTLYSVLNRLNSTEQNILTIEDPVERRLPGVTQVQVDRLAEKEKAPITFASALRSFLRQDPDIIMVGEIRDLETAEIATHAALTGHLVLCTLHTNDAPGAIPRLVNMGVPPFLVASSVIGVLAQRLVRVLCPKCREQYELPPATLRRLGISRDGLEGPLIGYLARPGGCKACQSIGYKGRVGVFELCTVTERIRRLVLDRAPAMDIAKAAKEEGMTYMIEDAAKKVLDGTTTVEEALRVIDIGGDVDEEIAGQMAAAAEA